jgi:hypothetical protein
MSDKKHLAAYARNLAEERDNFQAFYAKRGDRADFGRAKGLTLALALLHVYTYGELGQSLAEQAEAAEKVAAAEAQPTTDPEDGQR